MKGGTMPRTEVEQWALAVLKVGDTLSLDRMVRRGEVAEMCGVRPGEADRIIEWARMMGARGEPMAAITMPGVVRAMKAQRARHTYKSGASKRAREAKEKAEWEAAQVVLREKRARNRDREMLTREFAKAREESAKSKAPYDYTLPRADAHLVPLPYGCPLVHDIPSPRPDDSGRISRVKYTTVLSTIAAHEYAPRSAESLMLSHRVTIPLLNYMVARDMIHKRKDGLYVMTIAGLVVHVIANGDEPWVRVPPAAAAWQSALRKVREGARRMVSVIDRNHPSVSFRYERQMMAAGLIQVKNGRVYLTEYGWQWARMDLTIQG